MRDGSISSTKKIIKSSNIQSLDKSVLDAVSLSSPLQPLPKEFVGTHVAVEFTFDYKASNYKKDKYIEIKNQISKFLFNSLKLY